MGSGFSKMKKQAKLMQQQYEQQQEELRKKRFEGASGNGLVTIIVNGEKHVQSIKIKPDCVDPEDVEGLEDLIKAAFDNAIEKLGEEEQDSMPDLPF